MFSCFTLRFFLYFYFQLNSSKLRTVQLHTNEVILQDKKITEGPSLEDFIAGVVPRGSTFTDYEGELKLDASDRKKYYY